MDMFPLILWGVFGGGSYMAYMLSLDDYNENWAKKLKFYMANMSRPWKKWMLIVLWHIIGGPFYWVKFVGTIIYRFLMRFLIRPSVRWLAR